MNDRVIAYFCLVVRLLAILISDRISTTRQSTESTGFYVKP